MCLYVCQQLLKKSLAAPVTSCQSTVPPLPSLAGAAPQASAPPAHTALGKGPNRWRWANLPSTHLTGAGLLNLFRWAEGKSRVGSRYFLRGKGDDWNPPVRTHGPTAVRCFKRKACVAVSLASENCSAHTVTKHTPLVCLVTAYVCLLTQHKWVWSKLRGLVLVK